MNLFVALISISALLNSVFALISISNPQPETIWDTKTANYLEITSNDPAETDATVRFSSKKECFSVSVKVNNVKPIIIPRELRTANYLNILAVSNRKSVANAFVIVVNNLDMSKSIISSSSRGCQFFSNSHTENGSCESNDLVYVPHDSEDAKLLQVKQEQAAIQLAEDILKFELDA